MKLKTLAVSIGVALALAVPATSQASSDQTFGTNGSPLCYKWHFREFRDGLFVSGLLWQITQDATWCQTGDGQHFLNPPKVYHDHREGSTWNFGGWDSIIQDHKSNPNRWEFRVSATEIGNASGVFNEHNYPFIRLTLYPNGPSSTWSASCGCKGTVTRVQHVVR